MNNSPRSNAGYKWLFGCLVVPINGLLGGIVTWLIVDHATPCHCDGEPDAEYYNSVQSIPYGLAAAVFTAALTTITLVIVLRQRPPSVGEDHPVR